MSYSAEMAVIGGMMLDKECANVAADALAPEMFLDSNMGRIFSEALDRYWAGKPIDGVVMVQEMPDLGEIILRCTQFVPSISHFSEYVTIVQDEWQWGLVKSVSRFARNTLELIETTRELKELGVVVVFEEQGIDTSQMLGEMQLTFLAMAAQEESTSISKNMRWSIQKRMENGSFITNYAPYGYKLENGTMIPVPEEARVVKSIFTLFLSGRGALSIAKELNLCNVPTRQGGQWGRSSVEYLLRNERYIGEAIVQKRYRTSTIPAVRKVNHGEMPMYHIHDSHEPIISTGDFERVQFLIAQRSNHRKRGEGGVSLRMECPDCGNQFRRIRIRNTMYWGCRNRENNAASCQPFRYRDDEVKAAFLNLAGKLYTHRDSLLDIPTKLLEEIATHQERGNTKLFELNTALADLNEKAHTLQRLHNKGFIEDEDFREQNDSLVAQRKKLSSQRAKAVHGSKALEALDRLRELQEQLDALPEIPWKFDIGLFDQLVEKIVPISDTELLFRLKCGLELKEVLPK